MKLNFLRVTLLVAVFAGSNFTLADQKIKTKSNIKNDRLAESSSASTCADVKEGSADGKVSCKTNEASSSVGEFSSASSQNAERVKSQ